LLYIVPIIKIEFVFSHLLFWNQSINYFGINQLIILKINRY